jgi:hypothetical protein
MPIGLAFSSFFRLLFGKKLHPDAARYLPEPAAPIAALPAAKPEPKPSGPDKPKPRGEVGQHHKDGALAFLALLQREGRLVDFLREGLEGHDDATIGAAARDVHRGCKKVLDEHFSLEPMLPGADESAVTVPKGFDPAEIRLIGEARGEPPFQGSLRHHGWRATATRLPGLAEGVDRSVVAPAEVEITR